MMGLRLVQKFRRRLFVYSLFLRRFFNETHEAVWLRGISLHDVFRHWAAHGVRPEWNVTCLPFVGMVVWDKVKHCFWQHVQSRLSNTSVLCEQKFFISFRQYFVTKQNTLIKVRHLRTFFLVHKCLKFNWYRRRDSNPHAITDTRFWVCFLSIKNKIW